MIRRFIWVELHGTWCGAQSLFWGFICFVKRIKPSPQSEHAAELLRQMRKEGTVRTRMPFTRQNWRLTKDYWERYRG